MKKTFIVTNWDFKEIPMVLEVQGTPNEKAFHISCTGENYSLTSVVGPEDLKEAVESIEGTTRARFSKLDSKALLTTMGFKHDPPLTPAA